MASVDSSLREVRLASVPSLGQLYVKAAARSARLMISAPKRSRALPPVCHVVAGVRADEADVAAYQRLLGGQLTSYLPAGFVHVLAFPVAMALMAREDFPLPLLGMVHIANEVVVCRPLRIDEELTVRAWAERLRPHAKGTQVDLVVEVSAASAGSTAGNTSGNTAAPAEPEVAWRGTSTYLAKGVWAPDAADAESRPTNGKASASAPAEPGVSESAGVNAPAGTDANAPVEAGASADADANAPTFPEELPVPQAQWRLAADTGRRYAEVSGDRNPIHLSGLSAKAFGFPRAIAHGMYTASRALTAVAPPAWTAFRWQVSFAKPVLLPGTVSFAQQPLVDAGNAAATGGSRAGVANNEPTGISFVGWNAKSAKVHFYGCVRPLD